MEYRNRADAQRRVDRIQAFRAEITELQREGVLELDDLAQARVTQFHEQTLGELANQFDVDINVSARQLSTGMMIASSVAGLALCAAVFFLFYRFWGHFTAAVQSIILISAPLAAVFLVDFSARREKTRYFGTLFSLVALAFFVLNLSALSGVYNLTPSLLGMLAWALFALILAYAYQLLLVLYAGIGFLLFFLAALFADLSGVAWVTFGDRPEHFILASLTVLLLGWLLPKTKSARFPQAYFTVGLAVVLLSLYIMGLTAANTALPLSDDAAKTIYQIVSFLVSGGAIAYGILAKLRVFTNFGVTFFVLNLYTKFIHWWWDWMPAYLFFLVVGAISVGLLIALRTIRKKYTRPMGAMS